MRYIFLSIGWLSVGLGGAGIVLPLVPTTPFLLLACFCFSKGSPRFEQWLLKHQLFGPFISNWRVHRVIPIQAKCLAVLMLVVSAMGLVFTSIPWTGRLGIWSMLLVILLFIVTRRSRIPLE
ncbi:YbaN family protein [Celerinatantimonas sp. YJH-8]|uniref:YbaN family protein n=1 Tax=Celerinatantimonas sp. YJH-8 TaxID=3228714 RepID=UPI0038C064E7